MREAWRPATWRISLGLVAAFTLLVRSIYFGNPVVDADEQFYLLVGDRWLHGALPYVDIWDRKPPGLFALYALIRLAGGDGVIQYQVAAAAAVAATALLIAKTARQAAGPGPAIVAALSYPLMLGWSGGMGGQSPVFYNLPMAAAAMLVLRRVSQPDLGSPAAEGAGAMLLVGIALQIKYSAMFEGLYFGLALIWLAWRQAVGGARLLALASLFAVAALAPTAAALAAFALTGHGAAFVFANFTSILLRHNDPPILQIKALAKMVARLSPELLALGWWLAKGATVSAAKRTVQRFALGWFSACFLGILIFGNFFNHYALPLMVPLAIAAAPAFAMSRLRAGVVLAMLVLAVNGVAYVVTRRHVIARSGDRAYAERIGGTIRANLRGGALYVFNGEPILYHLTNSPLPTRWPFPYHLSFTREADALGVDPLAEVRAIMGRAPMVVVDTDDPRDPDVNRAAQRVLRSALTRDYCLAARFRLLRDVRLVYARKSLDDHRSAACAL